MPHLLMNISSKQTCGCEAAAPKLFQGFKVVSLNPWCCSLTGRSDDFDVTVDSTCCSYLFILIWRADRFGFTVIKCIFSRHENQTLNYYWTWNPMSRTVTVHITAVGQILQGRCFDLNKYLLIVSHCVFWYFFSKEQTESMCCLLTGSCVAVLPLPR